MNDQPPPQTEPQEAPPTIQPSKTPLIILSVIAALSLVTNLTLGYMYFIRSQNTASTTNSTTITNFDECVAAGNPILESYPEQCVAPDGKSFTNTTQTKQDEFPFTLITDPKYLEEVMSISMDYPTDLELYEHRNTAAYGSESKRDVVVYLCHPPLGEPNLERYSDICPNGYLKIEMNGDGWGGGCGPETSGNIPFNGEEKFACMYANSFNLLGHTHGEAEYLFSGVYSNDLLEETMMDILNSIEFVDSAAEESEAPVTSDLPTETIPYSPRSDWATYTDEVAGFSFQYRDTLASPNNYYPEGTYFNVANAKPGEGVRLQSCGTPASGPFAGEESCGLAFTVSVATTYNGGSRRSWLVDSHLANRPLFEPYFMNYVVDGKNALVAIEGNPGGSSTIFIAIPNGNTMILFSGSGAWDPDTGELPVENLDFYKSILSTFKFE